MARRRPTEPTANPARGVVLVVVAVLVGLFLLRNGLDTTVTTSGPTGTDGGTSTDAGTDGTDSGTDGTTTSTIGLRAPADVPTIVLNGSGVSGAAKKYSTALPTRATTSPTPTATTPRTRRTPPRCSTPPASSGRRRRSRSPSARRPPPCGARHHHAGHHRRRVGDRGARRRPRGQGPARLTRRSRGATAQPIRVTRTVTSKSIVACTGSATTPRAGRSGPPPRRATRSGTGGWRRRPGRSSWWPRTAPGR